MSRHLFTSDLHLGHEKVAHLRGFATVQKHDETVLANLAAAVRPEDVLWVLGDVVGQDDAVERAVEALRAVPGRKRLILGNHDPAHPMHRGAFRWQGVYRRAFEWVESVARTRIGGQDVLLSHFPYERDRGEPRFLQWRVVDFGLPLIHGHLHTRDRGTSTVRLVGGRLEVVHREVHVGLDAWDLKPVPDHVVAAELNPSTRAAEREKG